MVMACLGVVPMVRCSAPAEDSLDLSRPSGYGSGHGDIRQRWMSELDGVLEKWEGAWDLDRVRGLIDRV
jgi:hypothetical protein